MKNIRKMIGRTIVIICCVIQIFVGIQPIHSMVAENDNHISGNSVWADSPSIMGESAIVMEVSTGTILYMRRICMIHITRQALPKS